MRERSPARSPGAVAAGVTGTALIHGLAVAFLLFGVHRTITPAQPVYAVSLVAAPAPAATPPARPAPELVQRPAPPPPAPVKSAPAKPAPLKPAPRPPDRTPPRTEPAPKASATPPLAPGETPGTGSDVATVKTPGLEFPYPDYLRNIVAQVYRRWERPSGNVALRAEVSFLILRDGSVKDIRFVTSSRSFSFDLGVQGAIEATGNAKAFGPLPDDYPADVLPVNFFFTPRPPQ